MKSSIWAVIAATLVIVVGHAGCGCTGRQIKRPYPEPAAADLLAELRTLQEQARSFQVESVMDYWVGKERVKGKVLLMGEKGARLRINALNPTGDSVATDLACDGIDFELIDYNNNCQLTGPCNRDSIARLLRVSLEPDDFLLLVMGATPLITDARAAVTWDASRGLDILTLRGGEGGLTQSIALDGKARPWAVVSSVVRDAAGKELWSLQNKDFTTITAADGTVFRVPEKTQFKQPQQKADLLVRWDERAFNIALDQSKFDMDIPAGLRRCE